MTGLDVHFWRLFALGAGFALMWRAWPWLVTMGRACRFWFTLPDEARDVYEKVYEALGPSTWRREGYPGWYRWYVAFREVGHIRP